MKNQLTVLGSGISISSFFHKFDFRNPSGHLLQYEGFNMLLDCGEGMRGQMEKIKFDYFDLNTIFISHFHPDHFNLDSLFQALYVRAHFYQKEEKEIQIFGPPKIEEIVTSAINNKHFPHKDYMNTVRKALKIKFREYENGKPASFNSHITMTPHKVTHAGLEAYATRFELGDIIFAYSGDSGDCGGLYEAAHNADLFLCEATFSNDDKVNFESHLSAKQAGEIAKKVNAKHLALVHYSGKDSKEAMIRAVKKSGFNGRISVASDLDSFGL